jgi:hypothetical protein
MILGTKLVYVAKDVTRMKELVFNVALWQRWQATEIHSALSSPRTFVVTVFPVRATLNTFVIL